MKKVIVTGGAGFIGSHTVIELAEAGFEPIVVDNFSNSEERILDQIKQIMGRDVKVHRIDCCDRSALAQVLTDEGDIHGIIHFAAYKAVGESVEKPLMYYHNNLVSLINILDLMMERDLTNLVFSSSCTVYGDSENAVVDESAPRLDAMSPYGNTKRVSEDMINDMVRANPSIKSALLRYFNPIGAHPSGLLGELPLGVPNNLIPYITQTAAGKREQLTVFGSDYDTADGTCVRDYIHVLDLAKAHVSALRWLSDQSANTISEVFNLGTGQGNSVLEVIKTFEEVSGQNLNYRLGERREGDVPEIYADPSKAERELGWKTELGLAEALADAWRWQEYLENNW